MDNLSLEIEASFIIKAHFTRVWDVLTNPEKTKEYLFGHRVKCEWTIGQPISWEINVQGERRVLQAGVLLDYKKYHTISYTTFDPNERLQDNNGHFLQYTYVLEELIGEGTKLTIQIKNFDLIPNGLQRYKAVKDSLATFVGGMVKAISLTTLIFVMLQKVSHLS